MYSKMKNNLMMLYLNDTPILEFRFEKVHQRVESVRKRKYVKNKLCCLIFLKHFAKKNLFYFIFHLTCIT